MRQQYPESTALNASAIKKSNDQSEKDYLNLHELCEVIPHVCCEIITWFEALFCKIGLVKDTTFFLSFM